MEKRKKSKEKTKKPVAVKKIKPKKKLKNVLSRVKGIDLNPLAVLTTRINYFINISPLIENDDVFEIIEFYIAWVPFLFIWFVYDYLLKSSIKIKIINSIGAS